MRHSEHILALWGQRKELLLFKNPIIKRLKYNVNLGKS